MSTPRARPRRRPAPRAWAGLALAALASLTTPLPAAAQRDSVTVIAGEQYEAGFIRSLLLGRDYRDVWTEPVRVPVLDLGSFAGGLTPVERGSGLQTRSLRFRAGDGREYNFRSVNKDQSGGLHADFKDTFIDWLAQDQVSSKHPASNLITSPLLDAAGLLHPRPTMFVMPDDARLGAFRAEFAGMLGTIEVHPDESDGGPSFADAETVAGTDRLLEHLEESAENRVDSRQFLRARLFDFFVGDWDRHPGQWRWARYDRDGVRWWHPVPEDRDNAFSDHDGVLLAIARRAARHLVTFDQRYPDLYGLTANAQILDRRILADLPRAAFDSAATDLQRRLDDAVLARAVASTPPEYYLQYRAELLRSLQARRAGLAAIATTFYEQLAREPEVWATDEAERAIVDRHPDGPVQVRIYGPGRSTVSAAPYYERTFRPGETHEVRIYLRGGDDVGEVRGTGTGGPLVRFIGGGGADTLVDGVPATVPTRTAFYADDSDDIRASARTVTDHRPFEPPEPVESGFNEHTSPFRDWGSELVWFQPTLAWRYNVGPVVGGGPVFTRFGFRRAPYAHRIALRGLYAPQHGRFGVEATADFRKTNSPWRTTLLARASQIDATRFHGFGNDTPEEGEIDRFRVWSTDYRIEAAFHRALAGRSELFAGPVLRYASPEVEAGSIAATQRPLGSETFGQLGLRAGAIADTRSNVAFPRGGVYAALVGSGFPVRLEGEGASYAALDAMAATYLPVPLPLESTLALRAGGRALQGEFPFQDAAFLGGSGSLRGFPTQRFAGDAALFGSAEIRTFLTRVNFIARADLGLIAGADAGRVFVDGDSAGGWHTGAVAGIWMGILDRTRTFSLVYASGESRALYVSLGMPF